MSEITTLPKNRKTARSEEMLVSNVKRLLKQYRMNEAELARQANLPKPTVHKILAGSTEDPRISTLQAIANVFNLTIDELYSADLTKEKQRDIAVQAIPVISWSECLKGEDFFETLSSNNWKNWLVTENVKNRLYGLASKTSMESQFPKGTVFVIDPNHISNDGDFVIVKYPEAEEAALRELTVDGPIKLLLPINNYAEKERLTGDIELIGTVIQSRLVIEY